MELRSRSGYVAVKDARVKSSKEECASGMEQRLNINDAAVKDVPIKSSEEEFA